MQVIIERVFRKNVETKYGIKPNVAIKTNQHGDKWLSTFKTDGTEDWKDGDTVNIEVQQKGDYLNFIPQTAGSNSDLAERVAKLEAAVFGNNNTSEPVIEANDLPDGFGEEETGDGF